MYIYLSFEVGYFINKDKRDPTTLHGGSNDIIIESGTHTHTSILITTKNRHYKH